MLGDSPDVMDVSMTFTPAIVYKPKPRLGRHPAPSTGVQETGNDFQFNLRQAFLEMKNVFKAAPEITFWGGPAFLRPLQLRPERLLLGWIPQVTEPAFTISTLASVN